MKEKIFIPFIFLFIVSAPASVQGKPPVKKIYGYKQASIPGILPNYSEETDIKPTGKNKPKQSYNYWFYLEIPKAEKITLTGLWISGISHDIKYEMVNNSPIKKMIFTGMEKNDTTIMVPATKNKIILIYPSGESKDTTINSKYITGLTNKNELVIAYLWKNKKYYLTLKKLKQLNPDVRP